MLDLLAQREWSVEELAREMGLSVANTSQHLQVLLRSRLVEVRRRGTRALYRIAGEDVYRAWRALGEVGEQRLAEAQVVLARYLGPDRHARVLHLSLAELLEQVEAGRLILLDVRPPDEYAAGHLPGAQLAPLAQLAEVLHRLPRDREIVVYCRGPYCVFSDEAVVLLREAGFRAWRIRDSVWDWKGTVSALGTR